MECHICGSNRISKKLIVKEMMFGFRDEFEYFICANCGCLQIAAIPNNMDKYYPGDSYYSFTKDKVKASMFRKWLRKKYWHYELHKQGFIGYLINLVMPTNRVPICALCNMTEDMFILDIGCGTGSLLKQMAAIGYKNLIGIDKYIPQSIFCDGVNLIKGEVEDISREFDIIMVHHSLEHMPNQHSIMRSIKKLLTPNGKVVIRIPVIGEAFYLFKENWVNLDAPRHFYLHTVSSFKYLAEQNGFKIVNTIFDSSELQFIRSINYTKGTPLIKQLPPSKKEIKRFRQKAKELNLNKRGDNVCFILST